MGANNGERTYAYDRVLGWNGVLIEANPAECKNIAKTRPRDTAVCSAVSADSKPIEFETGLDPLGFAATDKINARWRAKWHHGKVNNKTWTKFKANSVKVSVPSKPLGQILREAKITTIDYFSLDVEGSELAVLETMDWTIPVRVWMIENRPQFAGISQHITKLFEKHGYEPVSWLDRADLRLPNDQLYVKKGSDESRASCPGHRLCE